MRNKKFRDTISGKGYYIALILCAVAIGITGYLYFTNANDTNQNLENPVVSGNEVQDPNIPAVATQPPAVQDPVTTVPPTQPPATEKKPMKRVSPVSGQTVTGYAMDCLAYNQTTRDWRVHNGIDIAAEAGTEVVSAAAGTVYTVYEDESMGMTVVVRHNDGYITRYSSLSDDVRVSPGQSIACGQVIGTVGNSALLETALGDHLHFSVSCNDVPVDPAQFLSPA